MPGSPRVQVLAPRARSRRPPRHLSEASLPAAVRTVLASFLFVDVVGFSKVSAAEQHAFKAALVPVLQNGLAILQPEDYRLRDTGDGALVTFLNNPEHALYLALSIARDCAPAPGKVLTLKNLRTGINLGTVRESVDVESRPNFVGDGINAAQRIMDFAQPGQVTASRSYMEAVALLDPAYAALFVHLGPRADKHGRQHELFSVTPDEDVLEHMVRDLAMARADEPLDLDLDALFSPAPLPPAAPAVEPAAAARTVFVPPPALDEPPPAPVPTPAPPAVGQAAVADRPVRTSVVLWGLLLAAVVGLGSVAVAWWPGTAPAPAPAGPAAASLPSQPPPAATDVQAAPPATAETPPSAAAPAPGVAEPASTAPLSTAPASAAVARPAATRPPPAPTHAAVPVAPSTRTESPPAVAASPSRPSARCSRIMEKAGLGEPLSPEEKKELATSC